MNPNLPLRALLVLTCSGAAHAQILFQDRFDSAASLSQYSTIGERFVSYSPPPLHQVSVENGGLKIETSANFPNGSGNSPVLLGSATLMRSNSDFGASFSNVLSNNPGEISWSFNVSNQDGNFNNSFDFILGSTGMDPTDIGSKGYYFSGGGYVDNRMALSRYNFGTGGGQSVVVDIPAGLAPLPSMGSFRITLNPATFEWKVFGAYGPSFQDPTGVNQLLGTGTDAFYGQQALPWFGFGGNTTGVNRFDNVTVSLIPEPAGTALMLSGFCFFLFNAAGRRRR